MVRPERTRAAGVPLAAMEVASEESRRAPTGARSSRTGDGEGRDAPLAARWVLAVGALVVVVGIVLRFVTRSPLWLDEALSVNIARLPLGEIKGALRHDGHPPLYYVLLHGWMKAFGTGDVAGRALSGLFSVAALPLLWIAGRRLGGPRVGWYTLAVAAMLPYLLRYG